MISDEDVKKLFLNGQVALSKDGSLKRNIYTQFFRGKLDRNWSDHYPGGCKRDMTVFRQFKVIPKYCFDCYKVSIELRNVVELFKLMMVFEKLDLPNDNTRKCMAETRAQVSGAYKGFIFCRGIEEGEKIINMIQKLIAEEISKKIPITLKRGCSEYALAYPEYAQIGKGSTIMKYREEWQVYEDMVDENFVIDTQISESDTNNHSTYTLDEAVTMFYWLQYAATIGDMSYLKISDKTMTPLANLKRPSPFIPVDGSKKNAAKKIGRNDPCICGSGKKYKRCCGR